MLCIWGLTGNVEVSRSQRKVLQEAKTACMKAQRSNISEMLGSELVHVLYCNMGSDEW